MNRPRIIYKYPAMMVRSNEMINVLPPHFRALPCPRCGAKILGISQFTTPLTPDELMNSKHLIAPSYASYFSVPCRCKMYGYEYGGCSAPGADSLIVRMIEQAPPLHTISLWNHDQ